MQLERDKMVGDPDKRPMVKLLASLFLLVILCACVLAEVMLLWLSSNASLYAKASCFGALAYVHDGQGGASVTLFFGHSFPPGAEARIVAERLLRAPRCPFLPVGHVSKSWGNQDIDLRRATATVYQEADGTVPLFAPPWPIGRIAGRLPGGPPVRYWQVNASPWVLQIPVGGFLFCWFFFMAYSKTKDRGRRARGFVVERIKGENWIRGHH